MAADEAQLVALVASGDQNAYRQLVRAHLRPLNAYVTRMLIGSNEAEDIVQETFLRLWTQARRFDPAKARLTTWLHNIAHNLCIDLFRKQGRLANNDGDHEPANAAGPVTDTPEGDHENNELGRDIDVAMASLPERQRSAIILFHHQGLSNREVAEVMGISVQALESLLARGRRTLRRLLADAHRTL